MKNLWCSKQCEASVCFVSKACTVLVCRRPSHSVKGGAIMGMGERGVNDSE